LCACVALDEHCIKEAEILKQFQVPEDAHVGTETEMAVVARPQQA
jgi:hypothetical protein